MSYRSWKKTLNLTVCDEHDRKLEVDVEVDVYYESNYGADADGNRGMPMTFIQDFNIGEIHDQQGNKVEMTSVLYKSIVDAMNEADLSEEV